MKLSEAIRKIAALPDAAVVYLYPYTAQYYELDTVMQKLLGLSPGEVSEQLPLLMRYPIFLVDGTAKDCPFWDLLPDESKPRAQHGGITNVCFLCNFLDLLRVAKKWDFEKLAQLCEQIEQRIAGTEFNGVNW